MKILFIIYLLLLVSCTTTKSPLYESKHDYKQRDYNRAFNVLFTARKENNPKIHYALGYLYYYGLGVAKDQDLARFWIRSAAAENYPPAIEAFKLITTPRQAQYIPLQKINL